jgi:hypothetical protein
MAKKFIHCDTKNGIEYASVYTPARINGQKVNNPEYLGRVVDKSKGIYRNRERGIFRYTLENGYGEEIPSFPEDSKNHAEEKLILDFGDAYCFFDILERTGYSDIFCGAWPGNEDTLLTLVGYKVLSGGAGCYADNWHEGSFTSILFPNAKLQSQRVSEFLRLLGDEGSHREFFARYLGKLCASNRERGVLIDSTGLPNSVQFPLAAINNHNGVVSREARLIFVLDKESGMPLFFRYNAGNIVDVSTLKATLLELSAFGVGVDMAIVDAGYYSEDNIKALFDGGISFLTRLVPNRKLFKELVASHADDLMQSKHMVFYRDRLLHIKRVEVDLFGNSGYAYVAVDHARRNDETYRFSKSAVEDKNLSPEQVDAALKTMGMFALISSEKKEPQDILPLYYTRQSVEQAFDIGKNNADLLPLRVHGEETFRGHLMLSFMASVAVLVVSGFLRGSEYNVEGAFRVMRNLKCKVFNDQILVKEPTKKMNDIAKGLKVKLPLEISRTVVRKIFGN